MEVLVEANASERQSLSGVRRHLRGRVQFIEAKRQVREIEHGTVCVAQGRFDESLLACIHLLRRSQPLFCEQPVEALGQPMARSALRESEAERMWRMKDLTRRRPHGAVWMERLLRL